MTDPKALAERLRRNWSNADILRAVDMLDQMGTPAMTEQEALDTAARGMTTITDAHREEARRRLVEGGHNARPSLAKLLAQALAEDAWTPPVDPDLEEARECAALAFEMAKSPETASDFRKGLSDNSFPVQSALIAIKRSKA